MGNFYYVGMSSDLWNLPIYKSPYQLLVTCERTFASLKIPDEFVSRDFLYNCMLESPIGKKKSCVESPKGIKLAVSNVRFLFF